MPTVSLIYKGVFAAHSSTVRIRSTHKEADTLITLHTVVALRHLGIIVLIHFNDTSVLVLALHSGSETSAESVIMLGTGAK